MVVGCSYKTSRDNVTSRCSYFTISNRSSESDPMLLRGAVFYIGMALWGPFKVKSLKHSFGSVLPSIRQVTYSHLFIVYILYAS